MKTDSKLDTLEPKHLTENDEGPLTEVPNRDRFDDTQSKAKRALNDTKEKIKEQGSEIKSRAKDGARSRADLYVDETTSHVRNLENVARAAREQLDDDQPEYLKKGFDIAASKVGQIADYFEENDSVRIASDTKRFAREHPAIVLGGLALAGFLAGRFVKATEPEDEEFNKA